MLIPRLELQAAVLATRLNRMLREELDLCIQDTRYWTNSEIVLHYLKNERHQLQTYVANQVEEIRGNSKPDEWNHVPGSLNPADDVSWGLNPSELSLNHCWLKGPDFLWQLESLWPNADLKEVPDSSLELNKEAHTNHCDITTIFAFSKANAIPQSLTIVTAKEVVDRILSSCSDWNQVRHRVAWLIHFVHFLHDRRPSGLVTRS